MAAAEAEYESVLCVKPEVSVYRIPPRASNRGYRASDWKLDQPDWTGRLRVTSKGKVAFIKLEDKVSGRSAFIGVGFTDRGDAFDFNVALQDHFKWVRQESDLSKESQETDNRPKLDLGFKEGQTIKLNIGIKKKEGTSRSRPSGTGGLGLLPPPPGGKIGPPPSPSSTVLPNHVTPPSQQPSSSDILLDFSPPVVSSDTMAQASADLWEGFNSAASSLPPQQQQQQSSWVQF
ncbi:adaptin ear-binding coat-associated protein 1 isoform X2 [Rhinatrema bivittatum]|uniref:adaptin ear-binding coat-associated protein 1 isoform X2 n=1 Tax=Rhinatrema bivittatum TaxID=194408 RepID=UPI0011263966|nr:adaptin ear-binding coat-associated protein 1 isoform X2 [Rhinatrema bivittatum]